MSCRYSPIGPIKILQKLQQAEVLGNYLLLLAHDVIAHETDYVFMLDGVAAGDISPEMIIMDNGVIELGKALRFDEVVEAANIAIAACIVMPDVLGDFDETRRVIEWEWSRIDASDYPIMKVPQGKDPSEIVQCIEWLIGALPPKEGHKDYWGIPRWITNTKGLGTRAPIIEYINRVCPEPQIHLLGMSKNITDDILCAHMPNVIGIDSANPIVFGLANMYLGLNMYKHLPREDYWDKTDINYNVLRNIEYVRNVFA